MADHRVYECKDCAFMGLPFVTYAGDPRTAEVLVVLDSPTKADGRSGNPLSGIAGEIFWAWLDKFVKDRRKVCVIPAVRCFPDREKLISPVANKCWKRYNTHLLEHFKGDKVIAAGFWAIKFITDRYQQEVQGKVFRKGDWDIACIDHPYQHERKYVKWEERPNGKGYRPNKATIAAAKQSFFRESGPVIADMFGQKADIDMTVMPKVPFIRITDSEKMAEMLEDHVGMIVMHDYETANRSNYDGPGKRTALDWFYGPEYVMPLCVGYTFFQDESELHFDKVKNEAVYDPGKVVVYTGPMTKRIAVAQGKCKLMAFNGNYDSGVTIVHTGVHNTIYADPMIAAYVVDQSRFKLNLESLAFEYAPEYAAWAAGIKANGKKTGGANYATMFGPDLWQYCAADCVVSMVVFWRVYKLIEQNKQEFLFWEVMMATSPLLRDMEARGVYINQETLPEIQKEFSEKLAEIKHTFTLTPEVQWWDENHPNKAFNPNSSQQVKKIYDEYVQAGLENTTKGTLKHYIEEKGEHLFSENLLDFRVYSKLNSTYVKGLREKIDWDRNLAFTSFKTISTATGRSSSGGSDIKGLGKTNQINIQNIPRGSHLRTTYRARPGYYLAYADYGQIELRVAGAYANSKEVALVCNSGKDFHSMMAAMAFQKDYEWIIAEDKAVDEAGGGTSLRQASKTISFGLLYGMTPEGLAKRLGLYLEDGSLDTQKAIDFTEQYFAGMPSVKDFIDRSQAFAKKNFFIRTIFGRIQRYPFISAKVLRQCVNTLVQATASDIFMLGIRTSKEVFEKNQFVIKEVAGNLEMATKRGVKVGDLVRTRKPMYHNSVFGWAEVHDSMTWEVIDELPKELMEELMVTAMVTGVRDRFPIVDEFLGNIPLAVDFKTTVNWV